MNIIVCGSSGFIGSNLVKRLKEEEDNFVIGVDIEQPKYGIKPDMFFNYDLRNQLSCRAVFATYQLKGQIDEVYNLACLMGGMGYIGNPEHDYDVMVGSTQIVANVLESCLMYGAKKVFYSSSACVYPEDLQSEKGRYTDDEHDSDKIGNYGRIGLKEDDAYPSSPDLVYGWQKLLSEQMHQAAHVSHGLDIRIARFHNVYGPLGVYKGGKEKAPAAMCRKVVETADGGDIEVWGTGEQTRSFLYIDDCIDAVRLLMQSDFKEPINIGSEEMVTINELANIAIDLSEKRLGIKHIDGPIGVMGRNSDNTLIEKTLGWKPKWKLKEGMEMTYNWIKSEIR